MALYHFCVKQIARSKGHSALAAAAYRSGEKIYDRYYGEEQDYTRKGGVVESMILLPEHVPRRLADRETLWYEVECHEKRKDAQLAYSFDIALQNELTMEENREILLRFVNENFISRGMICDIAIHDPERKEGVEPNPHAHILVPIRPVDEDGEWGAKRKHIPVIDEEGNPVLDGNGKPKMDNPFTTDWGRTETLEEWRTNWEIIVNEKFGEKHLSCHICHQSNEDRGMKEAPQLHEGSAVRQMERRGIKTYKGSWNEWVKKTNDNIHRLLGKLRELASWIAEAKESVRRIENPTITDMVMQYYEHRDEVAEGYARGTKKAKMGNLKMTSEMVAYIQRNNLTDIDSLETLIEDRNRELIGKKESIKEKKDEAAEVKKSLKLVSDYFDIKPVFDESQKIFFKKKKEAFRKEHEAELKKFYKARRLLKEQGHEEMDLEAVKEYLTKKLEILQGDITSETEAINGSALTQEVKMLSRIKEAVDYATKDAAGDKGDNSSAMEKVKESVEDVQVTEQKRKSVSTTQPPAKPNPVQQPMQQNPKQHTEQNKSRERVSIRELIKEKNEIVRQNSERSSSHDSKNKGRGNNVL